MKKTCSRCKDEKESSEFYLSHLKKYPEQRRAWCKKCHNNDTSSYISRNKDSHNKKMRIINQRYQKNMRQQLSDAHMRKVIIDGIFMVSEIRVKASEITDEMIKAQRGKMLMNKILKPKL